MDQKLISSKHVDLYLSTLQIGLGITFVPEHRTLHLHFIVLELVIGF